MAVWPLVSLVVSLETTHCWTTIFLVWLKTMTIIINALYLQRDQGEKNNNKKTLNDHHHHKLNDLGLHSNLHNCTTRLGKYNQIWRESDPDRCNLYVNGTV